MDITDHYELNEEQYQTLAEAMVAAANDPDRIWFARHGDDDAHWDTAWDVEHYRGQYVNHACFFVSVEPCKPEHRETVFTY